MTRINQQGNSYKPQTHKKPQPHRSTLSSAQLTSRNNSRNSIRPVSSRQHTHRGPSSATSTNTTYLALGFILLFASSAAIGVSAEISNTTHNFTRIREGRSPGNSIQALPLLHNNQVTQYTCGSVLTAIQSTRQCSLDYSPTIYDKETEKQIKTLQDNASICDKHMKGKDSNTELTPSQKIYAEYREAKTNLKKASRKLPLYLSIFNENPHEGTLVSKVHKKCAEWTLKDPNKQTLPENHASAFPTFVETYTAYANDPTCQKERLVRKECKQAVKSLHEQNVPLAQVQKEVPVLARKIGKLYKKFTPVPAKDFAIEPSATGFESNVSSRESDDDSTREHKGPEIELNPAEGTSVRPSISEPFASEPSASPEMG